LHIKVPYINNPVTHESRDNSFKNNDRNKVRYRVQMCYFCNEEDHKKYNCPKFNHFEYLKYQRMLNEESNGSANVTNERLYY